MGVGGGGVDDNLDNSGKKKRIEGKLRKAIAHRLSKGR